MNILPWCPTCRTFHLPVAVPCPPPLGCPDCGAPAARRCYWHCPRFAEEV